VSRKYASYNHKETAYVGSARWDAGETAYVGSARRDAGETAYAGSARQDAGETAYAGSARWDEDTRFLGTRCENACCDDALWEAEIGLTGRSALNAEFISARIAAMTALIPIKRLMVYFRDRNNVSTVPTR